MVASHEAMAVGSRLDLHFLLPEGQIGVQAIVRPEKRNRLTSILRLSDFPAFVGNLPGWHSFSN